MKKITYSKTATKALRKYRGKQAIQIVARINDYAAGKPVDIKAMSGTNLFRIRVGSFRVILDDDGTIITIIDLGPRGDIYK